MVVILFKKMKKYFLNWKYLIFICCCILCSVLFITFFNLQNISDTTDCPENILTFKDDGKLATQLWSYASIWAMAKINSRWHPYAPKTTLDRFKSIFTSSSIKLNEYDTLAFSCQRRVYAKGGPLDEPGDRILNFQHVPEIYGEVLFDLRNELKKELTFRKKLLTSTKKWIEFGKRHMKKQGLITHTFVAVLMSNRMRSDVDVYYHYLSSMDWFRNNLKNPLFIILGFSSFDEDDADIFQHNDVMIARNQNYGFILSIIARCNNLIIDKGAVAIFSGLFAHGYVHVYDPGMLGNNSNLNNWIFSQSFITSLKLIIF